MAGVTVVQGVDDTLRDLATAAIADLDPRPTVTVGPLDRQSPEPRLNWFLYQIAPNAAYRNMEPPNGGWQTQRGRPPLALELHYLLTAFPGDLSEGGDQDQFVHTGLLAVMQALHGSAILGPGATGLSPLVGLLVEPLRITLEPLDLDALGKLWTAAAQSLRLSVGYLISLVVVDALTEHVAGPPVAEPRVHLLPSLGPRWRALTPDRASFGDDLHAVVEGLLPGTQFVLQRAPTDPAGPRDGWPMTVVPGAELVLRLPRPDLAPGPRRLDARVTADGLPAGTDSIRLTITPAVTGHTGTVQPGATVTLLTAHSAPDVEVFLAGRRADPAAVTAVSATQVDVVLPTDTPPGPLAVALRAGKVAGRSGGDLVVSP
jgi:Pvc16 N-terminal domain